MPYYFSAAIFILSLLSFYIYILIGKKLNFYDKNNFFLINSKILTGSGIVFYILTFVFLIIMCKSTAIQFPNKIWPLVLSISVLVLVSFYDDFKPVNPIIKLFFQLLFVYLSLASINLYALNIPLKVAVFFVVIGWVYTINIINFIDGADGFLAIFGISFFLILFMASEKYSLSSSSKRKRCL